MKLSVNYLQPPAGEIIAFLQDKLASQVHLSLGEPVPPDTEILIAGRPRREHLEATQNLQALVIPWAGLPSKTRELLADFPQVAVHNLHHNAGPVAELALALLLAAAKFVLPMDRSLRGSDWTPRYRPSPALLLEGKTALILGYGAIGWRVAHLCRGLGMDVLAIRRQSNVRGVDPTSLEPAEEIYPPSALTNLLPRADALIICLPHTPETDGLIGGAELALLPPTAVLVNIGRGPIVEERALYEALRDGRLYAAGLDVWYNYPADEDSRTVTPPANYPFHELDNVVMSPHRGGATRETNWLRMSHLAALLNTAAAGEKIPNRVDIQAGY